MKNIRIFLLVLSLTGFLLRAQAAEACSRSSLAAAIKTSTISASALRVSSGDVVIINKKKRKIKSSHDILRLLKGANLVTVQSSGCQFSNIIVSAPRGFVRPYFSPSKIADLAFTRLLPSAQSNPLNRASAQTIAASMLEASADEQLSSNFPLGQVFFGQMVAHDISANSQFESGPSRNPTSPLNGKTPVFDLDNVYGFGPVQDATFFTKNKIFFVVPDDVRDVPRTSEGISLIPDKRDDENGLILRFHVLFRKFHNLLANEYLNGINPSRLTATQRTWIFELARNELLGTYQSVLVNELSPLIIGRTPSLAYEAMKDIPVEFGIAAFRLGHTLVPNQVVIDSLGTKKSPVDPALRGAGGIRIPFSLLIGPGAQKASLFDDKIAQAMLELFIPMSPTNQDLLSMVGGRAQNIGQGSIVDGVLRLNLAETNILRGRELLLPSGEEMLAKIRGQPYDESQGNTDLWVYILREAATSGNKLGEVGTYIYERSVSGVMNFDTYGIQSGRYSKEDLKRFQETTLEDIINRVGDL